MWSGTILAHLWESEWVWASTGSWHALVCSAQAPSCLNTAHFPTRNKSCVRAWILPPRYAKEDGKEAVCPLTSAGHSRLQAAFGHSQCWILAHILGPLLQVRGSPELWWSLQVQTFCCQGLHHPGTLPHCDPHSCWQRKTSSPGHSVIVSSPSLMLKLSRHPWAHVHQRGFTPSYL